MFDSVSQSHYHYYIHVEFELLVSLLVKGETHGARRLYLALCDRQGRKGRMQSSPQCHFCSRCDIQSGGTTAIGGTDF